MTLTGSGGNATVDTGGYTVTLSGSLSGPGGLARPRAACLVLAASNTYTGGTIVEAGILVASNGTQRLGHRQRQRDLKRRDPGQRQRRGHDRRRSRYWLPCFRNRPRRHRSIGTLTIGSLLAASNLTTLNFDLTTPGGSGDLLVVTGNLALAPNTAITFGTDPTTYGDYRLIGYGSLTGSLSDFDLPGAPPTRCTRYPRR